MTAPTVPLYATVFATVDPVATLAVTQDLATVVAGAGVAYSHFATPVAVPAPAGATTVGLRFVATLTRHHRRYVPLHVNTSWPRRPQEHPGSR